MVSRKINNGKPKKEKLIILRGPKVPKKVVIDELPDAIVEGKFVCVAGERLVFRRDYAVSVWDKAPSYVTALRFSEDGQMIELWDETRGQCASAEIKSAARFTLKRLP